MRTAAEPPTIAAPTTASPILDLCNIRRRFGGLVALDGMDLSVHRNEILGIIGPNGAGKSTLFNVITGQVRASEGTVLFDGRDITGRSPYQIARLGIGRKFQVPAIFPGLTVERNLAIAARGEWGLTRLLWRPRRIAARLEPLLATLRLSGKAHMDAAELSHGEKQWLEIGMVLVGGPKLLLLDEPTAGMTGSETMDTARLLRQLASDHTVVVIEHDIRFIREVSSRVVVMHRGRVLVSGSISDVEADETVRDVYLGRTE